MIMIEFSKKAVKNYRNSKYLIIADYRYVDYENECETLQSRLADTYNIDFYPIITLNCFVVKILSEYFGNYDVWIIDRSIMEEITKYISFLENISCSC